jgi:hypothetical protein
VAFEPIPQSRVHYLLQHSGLDPGCALARNDKTGEHYGTRILGRLRALDGHTVAMHLRSRALRASHIRHSRWLCMLPASPYQDKPGAKVVGTHTKMLIMLSGHASGRCHTRYIW